MARRRNYSVPNNFPEDRIEQDEEDEKPDEEYEVEAILEAKRFNGVGMYRIKWLGYGHEHNSWEPAENLTNCQKKLDKFREEKRKKKLERDASTPKSTFKPEPITFTSSSSRPSTTYLRLENASSSSLASTSTLRRSSSTLSVPLSRRLGPQNKVTSPTLGCGKRYIWPANESHSDVLTKRARIEHDTERNDRMIEDIRGIESKPISQRLTELPTTRTFRFESDRNGFTSIRRENVGDPILQPPTFMDVFSGARDRRENIADSSLQISSKDVDNKARDRREIVGDPIVQTPTFMDVFNKTIDRRENVADPIPQISFKNVRDRRESGGDGAMQIATSTDAFYKMTDRRENVADPTPQITFKNVGNKRDRRESGDGMVQTPIITDAFNKARERRKNLAGSVKQTSSRDWQESFAGPIKQPPSKNPVNHTRDRRENGSDLNPSRDVLNRTRDRRETGIDLPVQISSKDTRDRRENLSYSIPQIPTLKELKTRDRRESVGDHSGQTSHKDTRDRRVSYPVQSIPTYKEVASKAREGRDPVFDPIAQPSSAKDRRETISEPRLPISTFKDDGNNNRDGRERVSDPIVRTSSKDYNKTGDRGEKVSDPVTQTQSRDLLNTTRAPRENVADAVVQAPSKGLDIRARDRRENVAVADTSLQNPSKDLVSKIRNQRENLSDPIVRTPSLDVFNKTGDRRENVAVITQAPQKEAVTHTGEKLAIPISQTPSKDFVHRGERREHVADPTLRVPSKNVVSKQPFQQKNEIGRKSSLETQEKIDFDKTLEQTLQINGIAERTMRIAEDMDISVDSSTLSPITPTGNGTMRESPIPLPLPIEQPSILPNLQVTQSVSTSSVLQTPISVTSKPVTGFQSRTSMSTLDGPSPNFPNIASILNTVQRAASNAVPLALIASEKESDATISNGSGLPLKNQSTATLSSLVANVSLPAASISKIRQHWSKLHAQPSAGSGLDYMLGKGDLRMYEDAKISENGAHKLDPCGDLKSDALSYFARRCRPMSPETPICTIGGIPVWWLGQMCKHGKKNRHFAHVGLIPISYKLGDGGKYQRHLRTADALCVRYVMPADRAYRHVQISREADEMMPLAIYATIPGTTGVVETNLELDKFAKWLESKNIAAIVPLVSSTLFIFSSNSPAFRPSLDREIQLLPNTILIAALCKDGKVPAEPTHATSDSFLETKYIPAPGISDVDSLRLEFLARYFRIPDSLPSTICDKNVAIYSLDPGYNQEVEDMITLVKGFKGIPLLCTWNNGTWKEGKLAFNKGEISHVLAHRNTRKMINDLPGISRMREHKYPNLPGGQVTFAYFGTDVAVGEFGYTEFYRGGGYAIPTARFLIENPGFITRFIDFAEMNQAAWDLTLHPDVIRTLKSASTMPSDTVISPDELVLALFSFAQRKPTIARNLDRTLHELVSTSESGQELLPNILLNAARLHMLYHKCVRHFVVLVSTDERAQYYGNDYKGASIMTERTFQNVFGMMAGRTE